MRTMRFIVAAIALAMLVAGLALRAARAQDQGSYNCDGCIWPKSGTGTTFTLNPYPDIVVQCRAGQVKISTKTGKVTFTDGCEPDDAARSFWRAIEMMYPRRD